MNDPGESANPAGAACLVGARHRPHRDASHSAITERLIVGAVSQRILSTRRCAWRCIVGHDVCCPFVEIPERPADFFRVSDRVKPPDSRQQVLDAYWADALLKHSHGADGLGAGAVQAKGQAFHAAD